MASVQMDLNAQVVPEVNPIVCRSKERFSTVSTSASYASLPPRWADLEEAGFPDDVVRAAADIKNLPCLLGRLSGDNRPDVTVKVKNTFIEFYASDLEDEDEDEDCTALPMGKSFTWSNSSDGVDSACGDDDAASERPVRVVSRDFADFVRGKAEEAASVQETSAASPEELRQPEWSVGAAGHDDGNCRPCAWFWRPQGCTNGVECRHCHLCPNGEVKKRRKANRHAHARSQKVAPDSSTSATSCSGDSDAQA